MAKNGANSNNNGANVKAKSDSDDKAKNRLALFASLKKHFQTKFFGKNLINAEIANNISRGESFKIVEKKAGKEIGCELSKLDEGTITFSLLGKEDPNSFKHLKDCIAAYKAGYAEWRKNIGHEEDTDYDLSFELEVDSPEEIESFLRALEPGIKISSIKVKNDESGNALSPSRDLNVAEARLVRLVREDIEDKTPQTPTPTPAGSSLLTRRRARTQ